MPDVLPPIDHDGRTDLVRALADESGADAIAMTDLVAIRWLTGFTGSNASVAVLADRLVVVTDGRYRERVTDELAAAGVEADVVVGTTQAEQHDLLVETFTGVRSVGVDARAVTYARWQSLAEELALVPVEGFDRLRRRKNVGEIARIELACRYADAALRDVAPMMHERPTEADVRRELEYRMRVHGADGPSYDTIVASGPVHAARPHHGASDRTIVDGDTVVVDVGALVDGYHSDMTRSYVIGEPSAQQSDLYEFLLTVQRAGLAAVSAGTAARDVDATCRAMIVAEGYGDWFLHSTGHGVGLVIHEEPFESQASQAELIAGDVVTVEPGLYRVGFGGFRIEDLVEVTDAGCRALTTSPKESPCLPSPPTT